MVLISVAFTVFNNRDRIVNSALSVVKGLEGFDWEFVVVDN